MPVQIDEVQAELVSQPKAIDAAQKQAARPDADLEGLFAKFQQRAKRLKAD